MAARDWQGWTAVGDHIQLGPQRRSAHCTVREGGRAVRVLLLHGYSASNAGDGLLVTESLALLKEALDDPIFTIVALHPATFAGIDATVVDATPSLRGSTPELRAVLREIDSFDLVVGVGGGYLRAGTLNEGVKTALAHGAQLRAAARRTGPTIYLPQSVGPFRGAAGIWLRRQIIRLPEIHLRDDRSIKELSSPRAIRSPDLAVMASDTASRMSESVDPTPIISIRSVHGRVPPRTLELASRLGVHDAYIQSRGRGNDDVAATSLLRPRRLVSREELMGGERRRVIVAVRLHAALMALNAGHYVVHLAYERKGFGAYEDLGLSGYVFNVNDFNVSAIQERVLELLENVEVRDVYDRALTGAREAASNSRKALAAAIRERASG
ncbi:polysaccharide pyruvyl transferase family protein [Galbitalea sp. SE-J8]|uniref:polysaccharide pyruvyl transferase family protein n=1 Tax=Galbitalea sp. SE-J8 TaxID=3054952 RepID=UPI00259CABC7|nr:polysaccharide pyruvyl transferase family protein [Galbitalea sp. SE-J8]MDM4763924.1 polysaccharide pyruvyl transferase family protein [Galbitalea sp. SE-J8]